MKILIVFESITGNTKEVATAIAGALKNEHQVKLMNITDALESNDEYDADLYFIGSWTNKGRNGNLTKRFALNLRDKNVALFGTAGFDGSKEYFDTLTQRFAGVINDSNDILGSFYCQGKMREVVRDRYVALMVDHPDDLNLGVSIKNFDQAASHPNQKDLRNAKEFALKIVEKLTNEKKKL